MSTRVDTLSMKAAPRCVRLRSRRIPRWRSNRERPVPRLAPENRRPVSPRSSGRRLEKLHERRSGSLTGIISGDRTLEQLLAVPAKCSEHRLDIDLDAFCQLAGPHGKCTHFTCAGTRRILRRRSIGMMASLRLRLFDFTYCRRFNLTVSAMRSIGSPQSVPAVSIVITRMTAVLKVTASRTVVPTPACEATERCRRHRVWMSLRHPSRPRDPTDPKQPRQSRDQGKKLRLPPRPASCARPVPDR
jgi:hypothetical protein